MNEEYSLARDYHENSKSIPSARPFNPNTHYKIYPAAKAIPMEKNDSDTEQQDSFIQTLLARKSTRAFSPKNINLSTLSQLLTLSFGLRSGEDNAQQRTYASAGGRYPIEVYIAIMQSDDIEHGIYHYNIADNSLELIKVGEYSEKIKDFYKNQETIITTDYPCMILFSMVFDRPMEKYGERGYRFALLDAGHMSQNLYLVATHFGLGVVALGAGGESDDRIDDIIGLVHGEENVFYSFAVGHPSKDIKG